MAADPVMRKACENAKNSLFFDLAGDNVKWKTVSLLHIEYPEGDLLGKALAWCSLMPIFIIVGFITLIMFRRELHTITFFAGLLLGETINLSVKHILAQFRPCSTHVFTPSSYGMPSDHSQFMAFFALYSVCFIYGSFHSSVASGLVLQFRTLHQRLHYAQSTTFWDDLMDNLWRHAVVLGVVLLALAVAFSRVYLQYHTSTQIICGLVLGSVWAVVWFMFTQTVLTPLFPIIITWPVSEYLMIRDSTLIPSVMWFEYTVSRAEMRKRQRRGSHNSYCKSHTS